MNITNGIIIGLIAITAILIILFLTSRYKKIDKLGQALVITRTNSKRDVSFTGSFVWPVINQLEKIDITKKKLDIFCGLTNPDANGKRYDSLSCKDNIRANLIAYFYIGVNPNKDDILKVAEHFTCEGVSNQSNLQDYFSPKFSEALKTIVRRFDFQTLLDERDTFRDEVIKLLAKDLDGFILYQVSIDKIEQTQSKDMDPNNILDAAGIRKITEITTLQNIQTAELKETESTEIKKKHVTGENARLQLNKSLEEETSKTNREIENIRTTETNNVAIKKQEARLEIEKVRLKTDEAIKIQEENVQREVDVTKINNEKVVEIQRELVNRARSVEKVATDREVVEKEINKEKFVETEKSQIADIVAVRTKTERNIAQEEQETKNLVTKHETERHILTSTTDAKARAESDAIVKTTAANTDLEVTRRTAEQDIVKAETKLATSEKEATATIKTAEATRFEKAAGGLAEADVRARIAEVAEKEIEVEANRVLAVGSAEADVRAKQADAIEKEGKAEATKVREIGLAQAEGSKAQYAAMDSISVEVREHEVRKLNIEKDKDVQIASIAADREVAIQNGQVMAAAMEKADIQILGNGEVFDQIKRSVVSSKALDARIDNSAILTTVFDKYKTGERDLAQDLKDVLEKSEFSTGDVGGLLMTTTLADLIKSGKLADVLSNFTKLQ